MTRGPTPPRRRAPRPRRERPLAFVAFAIAFAFAFAFVALLAAPAAAGPPVDREAAERAFDHGLRLFEDAAELRRTSPSDRERIASTYRRAAESFVASWEAGAVTTEVFTNAANSYWFAGDVGESVLFYRRALAVDPTNDSARDALASIRADLPIRPATDGAASLSASLFFWHAPRYLVVREWTFLVLFPAAWLLLAFEALRRFEKPGRRRRWARILLLPVAPLALLALAIEYLFRVRRPYLVVAVLCLVPALACLVSLVVEAVDDDAGRAAVLVSRVQGRRGDGTSYGASHEDVAGEPLAFPPGTELEILEERTSGRETWLRVRLLDRSTSWIPARAAARIDAR